MMSKSRYDVLGIGGPIIDQILPVSHEYMESIPGEIGGMMPVNYETLISIIQESGSKPIPVLGGSARNMINGMARLGERCAFCGKIGSDELSHFYTSSLKAKSIIPLLIHSSTPTAQVLALVTPDGQRTFRTFLGASMEMRGEDLDPAIFEHVRLVHIEGYALYNGDLVERAMSYAQKAGAKVSFDLASFEIARSFRETILSLLDQYVDIVFANELESKALTGFDEEEAAGYLGGLCEVGIVLMGPQGCWVRKGRTKVHCPAYPVQPLDTTGAGDLFASGFLHAYLQGFSIEECAHYGAIAGRAVVQVMGAEIPHEHWEDIYRQLKKQLP